MSCHLINGITSLENDVIDLPDDRQAIENKWIFKRKTDAGSSVTIYKARLVAKGF